jgi:hypothetical protein
MNPNECLFLMENSHILARKKSEIGMFCCNFLKNCEKICQVFKAILSGKD